MSFDSLATKAITVTRRTQSGPPDDYNNPTVVETTLGPYRGWIEETGSIETLVGQDSYIANYRVFLEKAVAGNVDHTDRVTVDGSTYEVLGHPILSERPGYGVHHVELIARAVVGE